MLLTPLLLSLLSVAPPSQDGAGGDVPLLGHAEVVSAMQSLASAHPDLVSIELVGHSRDSRKIEALRIAAGAALDGRPAILVAANLEGPRLFSTSLVLHGANALVAGYPDDAAIKELLDTTTLYIVPRVNPDAAERVFFDPREECWTGGYGVDDDRDGRDQEDPPLDLNGDGLISMMRVWDEEGEWITDPHDPRAMVEADPAQGQRGAWKLYREGRDQDADGRIAEDAEHDTFLHRNFPAGWIEHETGMGLFPGDEPESRALMDFVIRHRDLALVVIYDGLDNLVEAPETVPDDARGDHRVPPPGVLESDAVVLARIAERYREITESEATGDESDAGTFARWCYEHRGLMTLSLVPWSVPEVKAETTKGKEEGAEEEEAKELSDAAKLLAGLDATGEAWRFITWRPFEHPDLGPVEIGGLAPFAEILPPMNQRREIANDQARFLASLGDLPARLEVAKFTRKDLGGGVWEVEAVIRNHAVLPLQTAAARRSRTIRPARVRLEIPSTRMLLSGQIQELLSELPGVDGKQTFTWLVRAPGGHDIGLSLDSDHAGSVRRHQAEVIQ